MFRKSLFALTVMSVTYPHFMFAQSNDICVVVARAARAVMEGRQAGVAMTEMMESVKDNDAAVKEFYMSLIIAAYDTPRYSTAEVQKSEIIDFENRWALECYRSD